MARLRFPILIILLLLGVALRLWDFPHRDELRHIDEEPYIYGSLNLLEGITPPYKYAPAGPQTWVGWLYAGAESAKYFIHPPPAQRKMDIRLRPFFAVNDAIWNAYADDGPLRWVWILFAYPFVIWSIYEAFLLGEHLGGTAGATLLSGLTAMLPLYIELTDQARPYMIAWAMAIVAISLLVRATTTRGRFFSAIMFGLAIGSRIEILALLPIAWCELWAKRKETKFLGAFFKYHATVLITMLLVAPWLLTNLIGNLRIIATVRFSEPAQGPITFSHTILDIVWNQGLLIVPLLAIGGAFLPRRPDSRPRWFLNLYLLLLTLSMLKPTGFGLQHQGAPLIAMLFLAAIGIGFIWRFLPAPAIALAALLLLLPLVQAARGILLDKKDFAPDNAVAWIEQHVPAGTILYTPSVMRSPLPTIQSSDALWAAVMNDNTWEKKFLAGATRFHLEPSEIPRALSEENMLVERALRRKFFILGSRSDIARPRYDLRLYHNSPVYSIWNMPVQFAKTGGVILWKGDPADPEVANLRPVASWPSPNGKSGTYVYSSQDVKLLNP